MAEEKLRITITADNKDALAKFQQTIAGLDGVSVASGKAGGATAKLGKDFTGMSRVIQDLPFGFTAISNNLTQLVPAAGAAGLAFSALIAGITFAQVGLDYWTRGTKAVDEGMIAATKSVAEFSVSVKNVQNDILAAREGVISKEEALKRYNETLGKSTGYASDLDEAERLMASNTNIVVQSLNLRARAQVMYQNAAQSSAKLVTGEVAKMGFDTETFIDVIKAGFTGKNAFDIVADRAIEAANNTELLTKEGDKLIKQSLDLEKALTKGTGDPTGKGKGKVSDNEKINGVLENYMNNLKEILPLLDRFNAQNDRLNFGQKGGQALEMIAPQRNTGTQDLQNLQLQVTANNTLNNALAVRNSEQMQYEQQLRESQAAALTNTLMNSVTGLFTAMQNGASLGDALGNMFKQIAIDIAKAAVQAAIFQGILMALPGGGSLKFGEGFFAKLKGLLGFSKGGTVSGPQSGYPVMLHGTEHIVRPDQMKQIIASASQMGGSSGGRVEVYGRIRGNDIYLSQQRNDTFRNLTT